MERIRRKLSTKSPGMMKESSQVKQSEPESPAASMTTGSSVTERNVRPRVRRSQTMRESGAVRNRGSKPVREEDFKLFSTIKQGMGHRLKGLKESAWNAWGEWDPFLKSKLSFIVIIEMSWKTSSPTESLPTAWYVTETTTSPSRSRAVTLSVSLALRNISTPNWWWSARSVDR